jgi:hypothetical protein
VVRASGARRGDGGVATMAILVSTMPGTSSPSRVALVPRMRAMAEEHERAQRHWEREGGSLYPMERTASWTSCSELAPTHFGAASVAVGWQDRLRHGRHR